MKFKNVPLETAGTRAVFAAEDAQFTYCITENSDGLFRLTAKPFGGIIFDGSMIDIGFFQTLQQAQSAAQSFSRSKTC